MHAGGNQRNLYFPLLHLPKGGHHLFGVKSRKQGDANIVEFRLLKCFLWRPRDNVPNLPSLKKYKN
jgi:hypothetical protein